MNRVDTVIAAVRLTVSLQAGARGSSHAHYGDPGGPWR